MSDTTFSTAQLLKNSLQKPQLFFTGIPIKKYFKSHIFLDQVTTPQCVQVSKWSAYAHFFLSSSITNFITKKKPQRIFIDALIDPKITTELSIATSEVYIMDTQEHTGIAVVDTEQLSSSDLVVLTAVTGSVNLLKPLIQQIQSKGCMVFLIICTPHLTYNLYTLLNLITNGGGCIASGSPIQKFYNQFLESTQTPQGEVYFSYHTENHILSSLEYQLSDYLPQASLAVQALYKILSSTTNTTFFQKTQQSIGQLYTGVAKSLTLEDSFVLAADFFTAYKGPIPDVIISSILTVKQPLISNYENALIYRSKELHQFLLSSLNKAQQGTLMIPQYDTTETYTAYLFFSTQRELWIESLAKQGFTAKAVSSSGTTQNNLFYNKYGIKVEL